MKKITLIAWLAGALVTTVCFAAQRQAETESKTICHVTAPQKAGEKCKNGDILLFMPQANVTPRNIVVLSTLVCDFNYEMLMTDNSLGCIFTNTRRAQWEEFGMSKGLE